MILNVKVIPRAKTNQVQEIGANCLKVHISAPAQGNKANKALIEILARYYKLKKRQITIIRGEKSHHKTIEIKELLVR